LNVDELSVVSKYILDT